MGKRNKNKNNIYVKDELCKLGFPPMEYKKQEFKETYGFLPRKKTLEFYEIMGVFTGT